LASFAFQVFKPVTSTIVNTVTDRSSALESTVKIVAFLAVLALIGGIAVETVAGTTGAAVDNSGVES
jgi:hypothetical protein